MPSQTASGDSRTVLAGINVCFFRAASLEYDKRLQQMAGTLARNGARVKLVGVGVHGRPPIAVGGCEVVEIRPQPPSKNAVRPLRVLANLAREWWIVRAMIREARAFDADVVHCMNVQTLLAGALVARGSAFVYDSREHYATTGQVSRHVRRWWMWQERRYVPRTAAVITVSEMIAEDLSQRYGIPRPTVVYNGCQDRVATPEASHVPLRLVHLGRAYLDRNLDELIDAVVSLRGKATLALQAWGEVGEELRQTVAERGIGDTITFFEPVPPDEIVAVIACYDVGTHNIRPETDSYRWTTANKLFEYLAAGLAIMVPDGLPVTDRIVTDADCGIVFKPGDIGGALSRLLDAPEEVTRFKANAVAASAEYSWATQEKKLLDVYSRLAKGIREKRG